MGWWWKSSNQPATEAIPRPNPSAKIAPKAQSNLADTKTSAFSEDAELNEFLDQIRKLDSSSSDDAQSGNNQSSASRANLASNTPKDISEHSLYPREMSCRSAFDYAFFCQSFGGQFVNVYRYGSLRSCSERWSDFWFCMRTNQLPEGEREAAIADHYRKKAVKYKIGPSSEDIWEMRTEPAASLFQNDFETLDADLVPKGKTDQATAAA
ncbi:hypothetical protein KEM54_000859 [Ascosphaera aggregata]|nr:hypothetical protein KEM54_000859 [Ascosphaera aggregata]